MMYFMGSPRPKARRREGSVSAEDRAMFLAAIEGALPLDERDRVALPPEPPRPVPGRRDQDPPPPQPLQVEVSGDHVRARRDGVSHAQVAELAGGNVRAEATLDLHGHTVADAEAALRGFLLGAARAHHRCVLVIHGKGSRTEGVAPVRDAVLAQLVGPLSGLVHAIATAPQKAGGPGATYVMVKS
jgi:DNA-nicking Smr family endonuclease